MAPKPPLVLLHAWPLDARMWRPQVAALRFGGAVHAFDLPGFGNQPTSDEPPSLDGWALRLARELRDMGVARAVFAGCSMGGYTCLAMLRVAPDLVAGFALVNSRAAPDTPEQTANRAKAIARIQREGTDFIVQDAPLALSPRTRGQKPDVVAAIRIMAGDASPDALIAAYRAIGARPDMRDALIRVTVPAAIIAGLDDPIVPADEARALAASMPRATFTAVPDAGHISPMEQPSIVNDALRAFWSSVD